VAVETRLGDEDADAARFHGTPDSAQPRRFFAMTIR
jgi:hypothetical protein